MSQFIDGIGGEPLYMITSIILWDYGINGQQFVKHYRNYLGYSVFLPILFSSCLFLQFKQIICPNQQYLSQLYYVYFLVLQLFFPLLSVLAGYKLANTDQKQFKRHFLLQRALYFGKKLSLLTIIRDILSVRYMQLFMIIKGFLYATSKF